MALRRWGLGKTVFQKLFACAGFFPKTFHPN